MARLPADELSVAAAASSHPDESGAPRQAAALPDDRVALRSAAALGVERASLLRVWRAELGAAEIATVSFRGPELLSSGVSLIPDDTAIHESSQLILAWGSSPSDASRAGLTIITIVSSVLKLIDDL